MAPLFLGKDLFQGFVGAVHPFVGNDLVGFGVARAALAGEVDFFLEALVVVLQDRVDEEDLHFVELEDPGQVLDLAIDDLVEIGFLRLLRQGAGCGDRDKDGRQKEEKEESFHNSGS